MKIGNDMIKYLLQEIENKSTVTLVEINNRLRTDNRDKPHVTTQATSQRLDRKLYSMTGHSRSARSMTHSRKEG